MIDLNFWAALLAGLVAGAVMSVLGWSLRLLDVRLDLHQMWGAVLRRQGAAGYAIGLVVHFAVSVAIAVLYAVAFDLVGVQSWWWAWGLLAGFIHWLIAGAVVMPMMPVLHPGGAEPERRPGLFVRNYGALDVGAFLAGHLLYGLLVGVFYAMFS